MKKNSYPYPKKLILIRKIFATTQNEVKYVSAILRSIYIYFKSDKNMFMQQYTIVIKKVICPNYHEAFSHFLK